MNALKVNEGWRQLDLIAVLSLSHYWYRYAKRTRLRSACGRHTMKSSGPLFPDAVSAKCKACEKALVK